MANVLNPDYGRLDQLRSEVAREAPSVQAALNEADRRMQSGRTWVGPSAAPAWAADLGGRRRRLSALLDAVIDEIEQTLASMDKMIASEQAYDVNTGRTIYQREGTGRASR